MNLRSSNFWLVGANLVLLLGLIASFAVDIYPTLRPGRSETGAEEYAWTAESLGKETPFSEYREIVRSRNLFVPTQGAAAPADQRTLIQDYELLGTFSGGRGVRAVLKNIGTDTTKTVTLGDWVGDYEIIEITAKEIVFDKGGQRYSLKR